MSNPNWQDIARQVQEHRDATIAEVRPRIPDIPKILPLNVTGIPRDLLSAREVEITESPTESLVESLASGQLTSREVTTAFLRRAGIAQGLASDCIILSQVNSDVVKDQLYYRTPSPTCSPERR